MKILHVITSLRTGGAEKLMVDLLPRMQREGHQVDLCVFDGGRTPFYEELEHYGVKIIPLGNSVYSPLHAFRLIPLLQQYDVVHAHNTACQYGVAFASLFASCRKFTTEHNTKNRRRSVLWKMVDRWMYGRYDGIVCISELTRQNLLRHVGERICQRCAVIYNGIDLTRFEAAIPKDVAAESRKVILMVSAFREQKDQKTLIKAMGLLSDDYVLLLAGAGEEKLIEDCRDLVEHLSLSSRVQFLGIRTDVPQLLQEADVVVLSSHYEGLSLSSLEGMASGRPFIASDVEGLCDIVGGYGILFPHEDEHALAEAIKHVCEDKVYAAQVAERCQQRARMFDINVMVRNYLSLYESGV